MQVAPTPTVKEILNMIPDCFVDNGPSDPFRFAHRLLYKAHGVAVLSRAARAHDAGYSILRLLGSGYERVTRKQWDSMYRNYIRANGHPIAAWFQFQGLRIGGRPAWKKLARLMSRNYLSFEEYLVYKQTELSVGRVVTISPFTGLTREVTKGGCNRG
jgi:hypothetical protein